MKVWYDEHGNGHVQCGKCRGLYPEGLEAHFHTCAAPVPAPAEPTDERAAFEAAFRNYFGSKPEHGDFDQPSDFWLAQIEGGRYEVMRVDDAWTGWKARAALAAAPAAEPGEQMTDDGIQRFVADAPHFGDVLKRDPAGAWMLYSEHRNAMRAALAERADKLHKALREFVIDEYSDARGTQYQCALCHAVSKFNEPERHAEGCLAAPPSTGGA